MADGVSVPVAMFSDARSSVSIEPSTFVLPRFAADFFFPAFFAFGAASEGPADFPCAKSCATDGGNGISSAHETPAPMTNASASASVAEIVFLHPGIQGPFGVRAFQLRRHLIAKPPNKRPENRG